MLHSIHTLLGHDPHRVVHTVPAKEQNPSGSRNGQRNVVVGAFGCTAVAFFVLIQTSRPAASMWSLNGAWFWSMVAALTFALIAGGRPRFLKTLAILTAVVAGMVSVIAMSATLGQAVSTLTFRSQFTAFAERADPTDNSADGRFWIGPFAYNRQCVR